MSLSYLIHISLDLIFPSSLILDAVAEKSAQAQITELEYVPKENANEGRVIIVNTTSVVSPSV
jgi:hypothetical protein